MIFKLYFIAVLAALFTFARSIPVNQEAQACLELCANCKGTATFEDGKCECDVSENGKEGAECLRRNRREVGNSGFNLVSCDLVGDDRKTRCTLKSKHFGTRNSIDQVAKYFMKDGPITGSIFKAPRYSVRSKFHDCVGKAEVLHHPTDGLSRASFARTHEYSAPPQQVIINLPQGYTPSDAMTGSGTPEAMTGSTRVIIQPKLVPASPAENVGSPPLPTQPKEFMPEPIVQAPHIITQPMALIPPVEPASPPPVEPAAPPSPAEPEQTEVARVERPDCADHDALVALEKPKAQMTYETDRPSNLGVDFAPIRMVALPKSATPLFMQSLLQHLSQPMLGIPQAVQTITKAPGISQIVSAPGNLLNSLVNRLDTTKSAGSKPKGDDDVGSDDQELKFSTNSQLFSHYDPDLFKLHVNPGDDFNRIVGHENPYSVGVPATHILVQPVSTYTMPMVQSPMIADYTPYDREYVPQIPTYMVGSPLGSPYFDSDDSYIPLYYDIPKMEHFINDANDAQVEQPKATEEQTTPTKEIYIELPVAKPKKICKKSSKDESLKKVTRDIKAVSESNSEEVGYMENNQDYVGTVQTTELPQIDRTTTQESIIEQTFGEEIKQSMTNKKTQKAKTEISSKIKKLKGEKKSDVNKK